MVTSYYSLLELILLSCGKNTVKVQQQLCQSVVDLVFQLKG